MAKAIEKKVLVRSVSFPIADCTSHSWKDFVALIRACWRHSTDLANWSSQMLSRLDVLRLPDMKELPHPYKAPDLYALAFGRDKVKKAKKEGAPPLPIIEPQYGDREFWVGSKGNVTCLFQAVGRKYAKERGKIIWRRERRTPEYLYPYPFPVRADCWAVYFDDTKNRHQPIISFALPGGRVSVRLRNGSELVRGIKVLQQIEAGELKQMELKICRQASHVAGHYRQGTQNGSSYRIMVRISYAMEVPDCPPAEIATVKTGASPFLTLTVHGLEQMVWHLPQVKRWIDNHERFRQRFADDTKFEKRWPAKKKRRMLRRMDGACEKHKRRMKSAIQEMSHQLVAAAARRRVGTIHFDATDKSYAEKFPWFQLKQTLQNKCDENGIVLIASNEEEEQEEEDEPQEK